MVVAFPPGGQADVVARPVAAALERHWRQPVPVVNRAGASGEVGNASVARARAGRLHAADGAVLARRAAGGGAAVRPGAGLRAGPVRADRAVHRRPDHAGRCRPPRPGGRWRSSSRRRRRGRARSATPPPATTRPLHVPMAMLTTAAGLDLLHVPFQGGAPALTALLGGQVQALASGPGPAAPHVREGRLRVLGCWGARAPARLPRGADPDRARLPGGRVLHLGRRLRPRRHAGAGAEALRAGDGGRGARIPSCGARSPPPAIRWTTATARPSSAFFRSDSARLARRRAAHRQDRVGSHALPAWRPVAPEPA